MSITLTAADQLFIEFDAERWTLQVLGNPDPAVIASAVRLAYSPIFATARRLSPSGLSPSDIAMVVVGWSEEDHSWHLGLLLDPTLGAERGGRWCEIARWATPSGNDAETAGRKLAAILDRPFRLVPPETYAPAALPASTLEDAPEPSSPAVQPLPLHFGEWTVTALFNGMQWERTPRWRTDQLLRGGFFAIMTPLFFIASLGALLTPFAKVQPDWLPLLGLALGGVMLLFALNAFLTVLGTPTTTVDTRLRIIQQKRRSNKKMIQAPFEGLEYVLISHSVVRKQVADPDRLLAALETWIHVYSPRRGFILLCQSDHVEGYLKRSTNFESRRPLDLAELDTPAHHAAWHVGQNIGIPVFAEER
jgi:hypothetical protein